MATSSPGTFDRFFDLPPEIRTQILSPLVLVPGPIFISPTATTVIPFPHALFLSHPAIYAAASTLFYEHNVFVLDLVSGSRAAIERALVDESWSAGDGGGPDMLRNEGARRRIRHLEFIPGRLGTAFRSHVRPVIADMLLSGALRHLKVAIYPTGTDKLLFRTAAAPVLPSLGDGTTPIELTVVGPGQAMAASSRGSPDAIQRQADEQYTSSEAFRGLLRLLADPVLETAELWVAPVHRALFCEFHDTAAPCQFAPAGGKLSGWRLVRIDWRGLARRCLPEDHEMHIVRVGD
ncbi:hypothetical protein F5X68DRAFT_60041 [Plectosphaerella plurivora]|uniref:Uncharacterized protein n=1 Tax=Plectosphaerella plurivora TaxID=936078 RepID=A0A9P8VJ58_9PEZI|nr:hypothetical protein F5X68DRAFT_60041 [Plectosphaerella plurivora]